MELLEVAVGMEEGTERHTPRMVLEAINAAQSALTERRESGVDVDRVPVWIGHLQHVANTLVASDTPSDPEPQNTQRAPFPRDLEELVNACTYRPNWSVWLDMTDRGQGCSGLTVTIMVRTDDTYPPHGPISVRHLFPVPAAAYNRESWRWWLFECFRSVEQHEAMEWFTVGGVKPYAPNHGPGWDPYLVTVVSPEEARRTTWRGEVQPVAGFDRDPERHAPVDRRGGAGRVMP